MLPIDQIQSDQKATDSLIHKFTQPPPPTSPSCSAITHAVTGPMETTTCRGRVAVNMSEHKKSWHLLPLVHALHRWLAYIGLPRLAYHFLRLLYIYLPCPSRSSSSTFSLVFLLPSVVLPFSSSSFLLIFLPPSRLTPLSLRLPSFSLHPLVYSRLLPSFPSCSSHAFFFFCSFSSYPTSFRFPHTRAWPLCSLFFDAEALSRLSQAICCFHKTRCSCLSSPSFAGPSSVLEWSQSTNYDHNDTSSNLFLTDDNSLLLGWAIYFVARLSICQSALTLHVHILMCINTNLSLHFCSLLFL